MAHKQSVRLHWDRHFDISWHWGIKNSIADNEDDGVPQTTQYPALHTINMPVGYQMTPVNVWRKLACCSSSKIGLVPKGLPPYLKIDSFWACRITSYWWIVLDSIQHKVADIFLGPHISVTKNKRSRRQQ